MREYNSSEYKSVAILGSFGKHYELIVEIANKFKKSGFNVLVPRLDGIQDSNQGFLLLVGDESNDPKKLENSYIGNCLKADFVYVCDKDGYIGTTVAFELGVLSCYNQEIFFMEKPKDELFTSMITNVETSIFVSSPDKLIDFLKKQNGFMNAVDFFDDFDEPQDSSFSLSESKINILVEKKLINK